MWAKQKNILLIKDIQISYKLWKFLQKCDYNSFNNQIRNLDNNIKFSKIEI